MPNLPGGWNKLIIEHMLMLIELWLLYGTYKANNIATVSSNQAIQRFTLVGQLLLVNILVKILLVIRMKADKIIRPKKGKTSNKRFLFLLKVPKARVKNLIFLQDL